MQFRLRMMAEDGTVVTEDADLCVSSSAPIERILNAGREFAKKKNLVLLSARRTSR